MKKLIFLLTITVSQTLMAQNVGIGTPTPQAKLHFASSINEVLGLEADDLLPVLSFYTPLFNTKKIIAA